ncbi:choice-of-anchor G family protein, partial [Microbacterium sp. NPDC090007]|uniref:choice-of-anchor G family protein n=1 Tax=Microbacterium sp. NPDC090007 TaxID=3364204 RepID=UPI00382AF913
MTAASAAPGDTSNATGTFLGGSILDAIDLDAVANIEGAQATSNGTGDTVVDFNTLDLTALGLVNVTVDGGIQVPLDLGSAGVLGQYAQAAPDGSSVGASGAVGSGGVIGTGAPAGGPLTIGLEDAIASLTGTVAADLVGDLADARLTLDAVSARAEQAAPDPATGDYTIASAELVVDSATLAALTSGIAADVAELQGTVDGLQGALEGSLDEVLGLLNGIATLDLEVGTVDLTTAVSSLLTGTITDPDYPGVSIDLGTGAVTVDLEQIIDLNTRGIGEGILTGATVQYVENAILAAVDGLLTEVQEALTQAIRGITIEGGASISLIVGSADLLTIDTTVGALLDGDLTGVELLSVPISLPFGLDEVVAALTAPLDALVDEVTDLVAAALAPVNAVVLPAFDAVIPAVASITVNNQSTSEAGVFSITAAIVTVLPVLGAGGAVQLELANATVGPNALDANADVTITAPEDGTQIVVPDADDTTPVVVAGTGQPNANVTVSVTGQPDRTVPVNAEGQWTTTYDALPIGEYTATATQDVDGSQATVSFVVVAAPDVVITSPTPDQIFVVADADDTSDVTVTGTGAPGEDVEVAVGDQTQTVPVGENGQWTATFEDLPVGDYTATATQPFDGSTDTVDFSVAETPDVVILTPADGAEFAVGQDDGEAIVPVSGTASPGALVTVTLDNGDVQTDTADDDGTWSVEFEGLPIGQYTATATQDADGSSDTATFAVVLADEVVITTPVDGTEYEVGEPDATRTVVVTGTGQAGAEISVAIPGEGTQTTTVEGDGTWSVDFVGLGVGGYTATATQDFDGSTDSTTFTISAVAADGGVDAD